MTETNKPDRWSALLETLGIPVPQPSPPPASPPAPAAPGEPTAAGPTPLPPRKTRPAAKPAGPPASRSPSYWSRIAGALGLEVPAEPEPAPPSPPPSPAEAIGPPPPAVSATPPVPPARPANEPPRMFPPRVREAVERAGSAAVRGEPAGRLQRGEEGRRPAEPRRTSERPPLEPVSKEELPRRRPGEEDYGLPFLEEELEEEEATGGEEAAGGQEPLREGRGRRRRRRRGRRGPGESGPAAPRPRDEDDIEPAGEEADFDEELEREAGQPQAWEPVEELRSERPLATRATTGGESAGTGERRRRRRRRRGRDGGSGGEGLEGTAGRDTTREERRGESWEPVSVSPEPSRGSSEERAEAVEAEEEDQAVEVPAHKKIPTWEDAVRILIDANMAARASQPDRGRDRGYGRGRSGR